MSDQISASPPELLELTVILPVFNEVENLPLLWRELIGVLDAHWRHVEIIFVDDMSTDGSAEWIRELAQPRSLRPARRTHRGSGCRLSTGARLHRGYHGQRSAE